MSNTSCGDQAIRWIQKFCVYPHGPEKGQYVVLTPAQKDIVRRIYDRPKNEPQPDVDRPLSAYMALFHLAGPRALQRQVPTQADIFSVWNATGPDLRAVLKRDGADVVCPELRTRYPAKAA